MDDAAPPDPDEVERFWQVARVRGRLEHAVPSYFGQSALGALPPPAWSFGASRAMADELVTLVLDGTKTATSSALADYEAAGEPVPEVGSLGIVTDGAGRPRALVATTDVRRARFDEVDEEHARLEGEGDRSLAHWRAAHEEFFTATGSFTPTMDVVLERFRVVYAGD